MSMVEDVAHRLYDALRPEMAPPYWLCERAARAAIEGMRTLDDATLAEVIHRPIHWPSEGENPTMDAAVLGDRLTLASHHASIIDAVLKENA